MSWLDIDKETMDRLPLIVFTYECGIINALRLEELYKPTEKKRANKVVQWCEFERCGMEGCDCKIVDHALKTREQITHPLWRMKHFVETETNKVKNNKQSNLIDDQWVDDLSIQGRYDQEEIWDLIYQNTERSDDN